MKYAEIKLNGGRGALLCNGCSVMIAEGTNHEDRLHFCEQCSDAIVSDDRRLYETIKQWSNSTSYDS